MGVSLSPGGLLAARGAQGWLAVTSTEVMPASGCWAPVRMRSVLVSLRR